MKIDTPAFKHSFIGGTSLLTAYVSSNSPYKKDLAVAQVVSFYKLLCIY